MLWMLPLAFAADDFAEMAEFTAELDRVDALIATSSAWYVADRSKSSHKSAGQAHRDDLKKAAVQARGMSRALVAIEGRLENGTRAEKKRVGEATALRDRIRGQNALRGSTVNLLEAGLALYEVEADPAKFGQLDNALLTAIQMHPGPEAASYDAWLAGPIEAAVEAEQWKAVFSWGSFCEQLCADKKLGSDALAKLPEKHKKDARWLLLAKQRAAAP